MLRELPQTFESRSISCDISCKTTPMKIRGTKTCVTIRDHPLYMKPLCLRLARHRGQAASFPPGAAPAGQALAVRRHQQPPASMLSHCYWLCVYSCIVWLHEFLLCCCYLFQKPPASMTSVCPSAGVQARSQESAESLAWHRPLPGLPGI